MGAAWLIARTELRRRWPSLASLALLVAVVGDTVEFLAADGARIALAGLSIGIPVGLALGRVLWRSLAAGSGALAGLDVPFGQVVLIGFGAAVAVPTLGWLCSAGLNRVTPGRLLQAEATR